MVLFALKKTYKKQPKILAHTNDKLLAKALQGSRLDLCSLSSCFNIELRTFKGSTTLKIINLTEIILMYGAVNEITIN